MGETLVRRARNARSAADLSPDGRWTRLELYLNGAFFTGPALDIRGLSPQRYQDVQGQLLRSLVDQEPGWVAPGGAGEDPRMLFEFTTRHVTVASPVLATRPGGAVGGLLDDADLAEQLRGPRVSDLQVVEERVDAYDCGVGILRVRVVATAADTWDTESARAFAEHLTDQLQRPLQTVARTTATQMRRAVDEGDHRGSAWYRGYVGELDGARKDRRSPSAERLATVTAEGRLLWIHRTYLLPPEAMQRTSGDLSRLFPYAWASTSLAGVGIVPGVGSSALVLPEEPSATTDTVVETFLSLLDYQWAVFAACMEIDRSLHDRITVVRDDGQRLRAGALEREVDALTDLTSAIRAFRSSVQTALIDLGGPSRPIWSTIAQVVALPTIVAEIEAKVDVLQASISSTLTRLSSTRQRRLTVAVNVFAGLSFLSSLVSVVAFLYGADIDLSAEQRYAVLSSGLVMLAAAVVLLASASLRVGRGLRRSPG